VSPVAMPGRRGLTVGTIHRDISCRVLKFAQIRWSRRESPTFTTIDLELPAFTRPGGIIGRSVQPMFECGPKSAYRRPSRLTTVRIARHEPVSRTRTRAGSPDREPRAE